jgi:hypothetical protein
VNKSQVRLGPKQRLALIAQQIRENPESDEHWKQAGIESVEVVRDCVLWHKKRGRDSRQVIDKMLRILGAITG